MAKTLMLIGVVGLVLLVSLAHARQRKEEYCQQYANKTIEQVNERIKREGSVPANNAVWSTDWRLHYNWCMGAVTTSQCEAVTKKRQEWLSSYGRSFSKQEIAHGNVDFRKESNKDRPGMDYTSFWLDQPIPNLCLEACANDPKCKAYTYVKPGVQGPKARCWLKKAVPPARRNLCCVSGVKIRRPSTPTSTPPQKPSSRPRIQPGEIRPTTPPNKISIQSGLRRLQYPLNTDPFTELWLDPSFPVPTNLKAKNFSQKNDPNVYEGISYKIKLTWSDNSVDETGFDIYRTNSGLSFQLIASVRANTTTFVDRFRKPVNSPLCYRVTAFKRLLPSRRELQTSLRHERPKKVRIVSKFSNNDCAIASFVDPPDTDGDGMSDIFEDADEDGVPDWCDCCPHSREKSGNPCSGCYDFDGDGYPDEDCLIEDSQRATPNHPSTESLSPSMKHKCKNLARDQCIEGVKRPRDGYIIPNWHEAFGDQFNADDIAAKPELGCPIKYSLRWMGMEVLNNSLGMHPHGFSKDGQVLYNEDDDRGSVDQPARIGEEPYAVFDWINGEVLGSWIHQKAHWCCGEKAGPRGWVYPRHHSTEGSVYLEPFEPDDDRSGEREHAQYLHDLRHGFQVFPQPGHKYYLIDPNYPFLLGITLMERDFDHFEIEKRQVSLGEWLGPLVDCVKGLVTINVASFANGLKGMAEISYRQRNPENVKFVPDPDDYMGTDLWTISREKANFVTNKTGAYPFKLRVPSDIHTWTPTQWPDTEAYEPNTPATMQTIQYFCLVRAGVPENEIKDLCSRDKARFEDIVIARSSPEVEALLRQVRANR